MLPFAGIFSVALPVSCPMDSVFWLPIASFLAVSGSRKGTAAVAMARVFLRTLFSADRRTAAVRFLAQVSVAGTSASIDPSTRRGGPQCQGAWRGSSPPRGSRRSVPEPIFFARGILAVGTWISYKTGDQSTDLIECFSLGNLNPSLNNNHISIS